MTCRIAALGGVSHAAIFEEIPQAAHWTSHYWQAKAMASRTELGMPSASDVNR